MLASLKIKNTKLYTKKSKNKSYFTNSFRFSSGGSNWKPRVQQITELMRCNLIDLPNFMKNHSMFRFRPCYSYFLFLSIYLVFWAFLLLGKNIVLLGFLLQGPWIFCRLIEVHYFSDYHLNTEISLYLEVVSLPSLRPASLVLVNSPPPYNRKCWSYRLMSLPKIFLLKAECAILPFENHGLQNLPFATFAALDHWIM